MVALVAYGAVPLLMCLLTCLALPGGHRLDFFFTADTLYPSVLYRDVLVDAFSVAGWSFPPSPYFFPDVALFFVVESILREFRLSSYVIAFVQVSAFLVLVTLLARSVSHPALAWRHVILVQLMMCLPLLYELSVLNHEGVFNFARALLPVQHFSTFLMSLICLVLLLKCIANSGGRHRMTLPALVALTTLSDGIFYVYFVLPALGVLLFAVAIDRLRVPLGVNLGMIVAGGAVAGSGLYRLVGLVLHLEHPPGGEGSIGQSVSAASDAVLADFGQHQHLFAAAVYAIVLCGFQCARLRRAWSEKGRGVREGRRQSDRTLYECFAFLFVVFALSAPIVTGVYRRGAVRYFVPALYVSLHAGALRIAEALESGRDVRDRWPAWFAIGVPVLAVLLFVEPVSPALLLRFYPPVTRCLDAQAERHDLRYGLADYWHAKKITAFSRHGLRVYQVFRDGRPFHHINNSEWYVGNERYPSPVFRFVVMDRLDRASLLARFGRPRKSFVCDGSVVWVYDGVIVDPAAMVRTRQSAP